MGSGRTLRKQSHTRPKKSEGEKRRRTKVQRARLVKLGMDEAVVTKMQSEDVRVLVQRPVKVKKIVAAKAAFAIDGVKPAKAVKHVKTPKTAKTVDEASKPVVKKVVKKAAPKAAAKAAPKAAAKVTKKAAAKAE